MTILPFVKYLVASRIGSDEIASKARRQMRRLRLFDACNTCGSEGAVDHSKR